ncbi:unnamed protein product [Durusdinium trenchii]|uniref:Uncharacterized protein n=2 Tax=Durusdinium trenchii TaxID=1381693 RepID=A0ABP0IY51_9DINO
MSKRHREDQWQESGPKFHFILWESSAEGFVYESPLRVDAVIDEGDSGTGEGPRLCKECDGVTEPWKRSLELVHCCLRMTAKEGRAFRPEVLHLAALSPQTAIDYNVESFRLYNKRRRKNVLTESTVLAVPVHVMEGTVSADESGVTVEQLQGVLTPRKQMKDTKVVEQAKTSRRVARLAPALSAAGRRGRWRSACCLEASSFGKVAASRSWKVTWAPTWTFEVILWWPVWGSMEAVIVLGSLLQSKAQWPKLELPLVPYPRKDNGKRRSRLLAGMYGGRPHSRGKRCLYEGRSVKKRRAGQMKER